MGRGRVAGYSEFWNLHQRTRRAPQCRERADETDKKRLIIFVEWNI